MKLCNTRQKHEYKQNFNIGTMICHNLLKKRTFIRYQKEMVKCRRKQGNSKTMGHESNMWESQAQLQEMIHENIWIVMKMNQV